MVEVTISRVERKLQKQPRLFTEKGRETRGARGSVAAATLEAQLWASWWPRQEGARGGHPACWENPGSPRGQSYLPGTAPSPCRFSPVSSRTQSALTAALALVGAAVPAPALCLTSSGPLLWTWGGPPWRSPRTWRLWLWTRTTTGLSSGRRCSLAGCWRAPSQVSRVGSRWGRELREGRWVGQKSRISLQQEHQRSFRESKNT